MACGDAVCAGARKGEVARLIVGEERKRLGTFMYSILNVCGFTDRE